MDFRTKISLQKERVLIDHNSTILLLGSCFSESIYNKLDYFKFPADKNPFGIVYNPKAIENLILNVINEKEFSEKDVFHLNERWHCFDAHSELSNSNKDLLLKNLNSQLHKITETLKEATHIIITLGTAWVYRHIETDKIVSNCHKIPQKKFLKELLSADEVEDSLKAIIALIKSVNPAVQLLFTISPIRHLKDGFTENSISKAHLRTAVNQVVDQKKEISYFPSFEIMLDDLRDYRFYSDDMVHPNETAITYIWEAFKATWINDTTFPIMQQIDAIRKGLSHRPFNPNSEQHKNFLAQLRNKMNILEADFDIQF